MRAQYNLIYKLPSYTSILAQNAIYGYIATPVQINTHIYILFTDLPILEYEI